MKELKAYLRSKWKGFAAVVASVVAVFAGVGTISSNWDSVESGIPAHRGYVREHVRVAQAPQQMIYRDIQLEINDGKRTNAASDLAKWKLEKLKTKDPVTLELIDKQIGEKEREIDGLVDQRKTLNKLKSEGK